MHSKNIEYEEESRRVEETRMQNSYLELEERRRVEVTMMQSSCLE